MAYCEYCGQKIKKYQLTRTLLDGKIIHRDCKPKTRSEGFNKFIDDTW